MSGRSEEDEFASVVLDSQVRSGCSPAFEKDEKGIKINAPPSIQAVFDMENQRLDPSTRFPVCIAMQLPLKEMVKHDCPRSLITLVMVSKNTGESFSGKLHYARPMGPLTKSELPEKVLATRIQRYYYNINLCHYLELPAVLGIYFLFAAFEDRRSNKVAVAVR